jgi:hypothetical protein
MSVRTRVVISAIGLFALHGAASAQSTNDVTFRVPINLTQLSPEIGSVIVNCAISSKALPGWREVFGGAELPVVDGRIAATATVVVQVPALDLSSSPPPSAGYRCEIKGKIKDTTRVGDFRHDAQDAAFRVSPTPARLQGGFSW